MPAYIRLAVAIVSASILSGCQGPQPSVTPRAATMTTEAPAVVDQISLKIEADIKADRLTLPEGRNALDRVEKLAMTNPGDARVVHYRRKIANRLTTLSEKAYLNNEKYRAKLLAQRALFVEPGHPQAKNVLDTIKKLKQDEQEQSSAQPRIIETVEFTSVDTSDSIQIVTIAEPELIATRAASPPGKAQMQSKQTPDHPPVAFLTLNTTQVNKRHKDTLSVLDPYAKDIAAEKLELLILVKNPDDKSWLKDMLGDYLASYGANENRNIDFRIVQTEDTILKLYAPGRRPEL